MEFNLSESTVSQIHEAITGTANAIQLIARGTGNEILEWELVEKIYPPGELIDQADPLVLKVKDKSNREYALKLFHFREGEYEFLSDDLTTAAALSNFKYIIKTFQAKLYPHNRLAYLLMEHFETDLEKALQHKLLRPVNKLAVIRNLSAGIKYIHENRKPHNDIKPANIFLERDKKKIDWIPAIADFGRYKIGTALYSHPQKLERLQAIREGEPQLLADMQKWDIFSMGLVFYFIIMADLPQTWKAYISAYERSGQTPAYSLNNQEFEILRQNFFTIFKQARTGSPKRAAERMAVLETQLLAYQGKNDKYHEA